jgi:osmotically-inducible protein OsmY
MAQRERYGSEDYGRETMRGRGRWSSGDDERGRYGGEWADYGSGSDYERRGRSSGRDYDQDDERRFGAEGGWRDYSSGSGRESGYGRNYGPEVQHHYGFGANQGQGEYGGQRMGQGMQPGTQNQGPYRGHGPRGYTRSDDRIREDVCDRLADDSMLDATEIEVEVKEGEVTLSGTVRQRGDRRRAEDIADAAFGVKHVQNNLRVKQEEAGSDDKSEMRQGAAAARTGRRQ